MPEAAEQSGESQTNEADKGVDKGSEAKAPPDRVADSGKGVPPKNGKAADADKGNLTGIEPKARRMGGAGEGAGTGKEGEGETKVEEPKARDDGKPAWLPAKFKSEEDLALSYKELERQKFQRRDDLKKEIADEMKAESRKGVPNAPVDYTFKPQKMPDGQEVKLNTDDPLTKWFQNVAFEFGLPQERFEKLVAEYVKVDMMRGPDWSKEAAELGSMADERLDRIGGWARGNLPQEHYDTFAKIPATAAMTKFFEHVMTLTGEPAFVPDDSDAGFKENLTKDDLRKMVADPKYWREKDPRFIAQVRAGYRRLGAN